MKLPKQGKSDRDLMEFPEDCRPQIKFQPPLDSGKSELDVQPTMHSISALPNKIPEIDHDLMELLKRARHCRSSN